MEFGQQDQLDKSNTIETMSNDPTEDSPPPPQRTPNFLVRLSSKSKFSESSKINPLRKSQFANEEPIESTAIAPEIPSILLRIDDWLKEKGVHPADLGVTEQDYFKVKHKQVREKLSLRGFIRAPSTGITEDLVLSPSTLNSPLLARRNKQKSSIVE